MALYFLLSDASKNLLWSTSPVVLDHSNVIANVSTDEVSWNFNAAKPSGHEQLSMESTTDEPDWN